MCFWSGTESRCLQCWHRLSLFQPIVFWRVSSSRLTSGPTDLSIVSLKRFHTPCSKFDQNPTAQQRGHDQSTAIVALHLTRAVFQIWQIVGELNIIFGFVDVVNQHISITTGFVRISTPIRYTQLYTTLHTSVYCLPRSSLLLHVSNSIICISFRYLMNYSMHICWSVYICWCMRACMREVARTLPARRLSGCHLPSCACEHSPVARARQWRRSRKLSGKGNVCVCVCVCVCVQRSRLRVHVTTRWEPERDTSRVWRHNVAGQITKIVHLCSVCVLTCHRV